ncbi:hypothetical protein [Sporichthya polymorpha]|uniref:hypothetical protein n=1 Tax=Sporichthya polymorpha TaxID=35751 RepID=UPI000374B937|nr:hypothetical protein [Sporichthya polymorpha]
MVRTSSVVGVVVGLTCSCAWLGATAGSATAGAAYEALARTDASTVTIGNESIPTGIDIEAGGPVARVVQDSLGIRDASAALPYAGDTVAGLPGLGASLFGFTAPPYPFVAASTAGSPPQNVAYPGMNLEAESADLHSRARAVAGEPGAGASASASVVEDRLGTVVAVASTAVDTIKLGPYGVLSNVRTVAEVAADGNSGKLTRSTSSSIGRISVPGLSFTVPEQSPGAVPIPIPLPGVPNQDPIPAPPFPFPGAGTTFHDPDLGVQDGYFTVTAPGQDGPQRFAVPTQPVLDALKAAGITLRFQAPEHTATGVVAGSYIVTYTLPAPPSNSYWNGPTTITQTTAYGIASVNLTPTATGSVLGAPVSAGTGSGAVPGVDAAGAVDLLPGTDAGALPGAVPATVDLFPTADRTQFTAAYPLGRGVDALYLTLLALAVVGALATAGVIRFGVRSS